MGYGYGESHKTYHDEDAINNESGKRCKKIFSNAMLAHVWAQNVQSFGQSGNGNFYFEGRTLYSYGSHFVVAHLIGSDSVLMSNCTHSISTSGHQQEAGSAASHKTIIYVNDCTELLKTGVLGDKDDSYAGQARTAAKWRLYKQKTVKEYLLKNHVDTESAAALLFSVGVRAPAIVAQKIETRRAANALKARNKLAAKEKAKNLKHATKYAGQSIAQMRITWANESNWWQDQSIKRLHHAHKAAKAAHRTGQTPKLWARLKVLRKLKKLRDARPEWVSRVNARRKAIRSYRESMCILEKRALTIDESNRLVQAATRLHGITRNEDLNHRMNLVILWGAISHKTAQRKERRERAAMVRKARVEWLAGGYVNANLDITPENGSPLLRAVDVKTDKQGQIIGGELQTSMGVSVPLVTAVKVFRFVKLVRERGKPWQRNGARIRVGQFELNAISSNGDFIAGCHKIRWQEIQEIALKLGVFKLAANSEALQERESA
jgi:hypothetical protein